MEPLGIREFTSGYDRVLVIEEKRPVIEQQLVQLLYNLPSTVRPEVIGKQDTDGNPLISSVGELNPDALLRLVGEQVLMLSDDPALKAKVSQFDRPESSEGSFGSGMGDLVRMPSFCAGCPHNTSTKKPDGAIAASGIGCHTMVVWLPERDTLPPTQMGGEGATWIGQSPFLKEQHMFQNIGDGTYFHSGLLSIRANITAGTNITYKILVNGAIAMTGGQKIEGEDFRGEITAPHIAWQMFAEGVKHITVISDDPERHDKSQFPQSVEFYDRREMSRIQRKMQGIKGVSILLYEQACATERRRLRKRGEYPDPQKRLFINTDVCEGCGDCGVQSNCIALEPVETDWGRKRRINQSACNKDYSCVNGLCPSFVTVYGGKLKELKSDASVPNLLEMCESLDQPKQKELGEMYNIIVAGIGGSGVITIGALLGMAAHLEGSVASILDMTGLAQRNGPVSSHIRIISTSGDYATRIPRGGADLVIASDLVVATGQENFGKLNSESTVVFNSYVAPTSGFAVQPDLSFDHSEMENAIADVVADDAIHHFDATRVAIKLLGNAAGANLFLVGYAWQAGLLPLSREAIERAIELNGIAVEMNLNAFSIGRLAAAQPQKVLRCLESIEGDSTQNKAEDAGNLDQLVSRRYQFLTEYQNQSYADKFKELVSKVRVRETEVMGAEGKLSEAVARGYSKLMAYKDEYEVARLYSTAGFKSRLQETFEGEVKLAINLAPPLFSRRDPETGRHRKKEFGGWIFPALGMVANLRFLRGTTFDLFGYSSHRRLERRLIEEYRNSIDALLPRLSVRNIDTIVEIVDLPSEIRGYDRVKEDSVQKVKEKQRGLLAVLENR